MLLCLDTLALGLSFFSSFAGLILLSGNSETFCLGFLSCDALSLLCGSFEGFLTLLLFLGDGDVDGLFLVG